MSELLDSRPRCVSCHGPCGAGSEYRREGWGRCKACIPPPSCDNCLQRINPYDPGAQHTRGRKGTCHLCGDCAPRCPGCDRALDVGFRTKVRGTFWCSSCSSGVQKRLHGHDTAERARVDRLNTAYLARVKARDPRAPKVRIETPEIAAERAAIVAFLKSRALALGGRGSAKHGPGEYLDASQRLRAIAEGIESDGLAPEAAVERLRMLAGEVGEPLSAELGLALKGMRHGKHQPAPAPAPVLRIAEPEPVRLRVDVADQADDDEDLVLELVVDERQLRLPGAT